MTHRFAPVPVIVAVLVATMIVRSVEIFGACPAKAVRLAVKDGWRG